MAETEKKPATKKTAPRKRAAATKAGAKKTGAASKEHGMNDEEMCEKVLAAALPHAAFDGFTDKVLVMAGDEAGLSGTELTRLFPDGPISLIEYFSGATDREMERRLAALDLKAMKIRERIATAVRTRLAILKRHKEAARRAAALLSLPMHLGVGAKLVYRTVDAIWRAVGDTATDFNFYTKRAILAGVYSATLMRWFNDTSVDEKPTEDFLAARIENVMQFEKFKARTRDALSGFPMFADWVKPRAK